MLDPDADAPPLPQEPPAPPAALRAGCIAVCGLGLLPVLYVGSFALLVLDERFEGPFLRSLDERSIEIVVVIYWPLIWLYEAFFT